MLTLAAAARPAPRSRLPAPSASLLPGRSPCCACARGARGRVLLLPASASAEGPSSPLSTRRRAPSSLRQLPVGCSPPRSACRRSSPCCCIGRRRGAASERGRTRHDRRRPRGCFGLAAECRRARPRPRPVRCARPSHSQRQRWVVIGPNGAGSRRCSPRSPVSFRSLPDRCASTAALGGVGAGRARRTPRLEPAVLVGPVSGDGARDRGAGARPRLLVAPGRRHGRHCCRSPAREARPDRLGRHRRASARRRAATGRDRDRAAQEAPLLLLDEPASHSTRRTKRAFCSRCSPTMRAGWCRASASLHDSTSRGILADHCIVLDGKGGAVAGGATASSPPNA